MTDDNLTLVMQRRIEIPVDTTGQCDVCSELMASKSSIYATSPEMLRNYVAEHEHYKEGYTEVLRLPAHREPGVNNTRIRVVPDCDRQYIVRQEGKYRIDVYEGSVHKASLDLPAMSAGDALTTLAVSLSV